MPWVVEILGMIADIFHHKQTLSKISFNLQVHKNTTRETSSKREDSFREADMESRSKDHRKYEGNHKNLDAKYKDCRVICVETNLHIFI